MRRNISNETKDFGSNYQSKRCVLPEDSRVSCVSGMRRTDYIQQTSLPYVSSDSVAVRSSPKKCVWKRLKGSVSQSLRFLQSVISINGFLCLYVLGIGATFDRAAQ